MNNSINKIERRYDIDWLRVITIGLLLIYHIAIAFQPWGIYIGFIQNTESLEWLWIPLTMLNVWRIPILFLVSGMGLSFALRKRSIKALLLERSKRILLPFAFGVLAIVPIHIFLWENYYGQDMMQTFAPGHLWFLGNIIIYVLMLCPFLFFYKKNTTSDVVRKVKIFFQSPWSLLFFVVVFVAEALILNPKQFELYAMTWHGFVLGFLAFSFGFLFIQAGEMFWKNLVKFRWAFFSIAVVLYAIRLVYYELQSPAYLVAIESVFWMYVMLAFASKYRNQPSKALSYLSQAAYPIYIIHMVFLFLGSVFIFPLEIAAWLKLILLIVFTFTGCMLTYEFIIRRIKYIRPLFGLKY